MDTKIDRTDRTARRKETLAPVAVGKKREESWIVDFAMVIAGRIELTAFLDEGQEISVEHSEVLSKEGKFFNNILGRNKDQTDIFVGGDGRSAGT